MKKVGIIGLGYVGNAVLRLFKHREDIYDIRTFTRGDNEVQQAQVDDCDLAIVCVPTPMKEDGSCDLTEIHNVFSWLQNVPLIIIKSTIPPSTTEALKKKYKMKIVFSPEYIGEGKYFVDHTKYPHPTEMIYHKFQIFGGDKSDTSAAIQYFYPIMGASVEYLQTDSKTAEMVKYVINSWGATKVTFFNEIFEICNALKLSFEEVRELVLKDTRIEPMHTMVFKDSRGFGGKCFPKDVNAMYKWSKKNGYDAEFIKAILDSNNRFRGEVK